MRESTALHDGWIAPATSAPAFTVWLGRCEDGRCVHRLVLAGTEIAGFVTLSEVVRGSFQNAFISYGAVQRYAGRGIMTAGMRLVLNEAFGPLALHRVEANIQPGNRPSAALVRRLGFVLEGFSERYLQVAGQWRDHERWAITRERWRELRPRGRSAAAQSPRR